MIAPPAPPKTSPGFATAEGRELRLEARPSACFNRNIMAARKANNWANYGVCNVNYFLKKEEDFREWYKKLIRGTNMKGGFHAASDPTLLAASTKARTLVGSFFPGADSTPLDTSTANGRTWHTASATFCGVSPPARKTGLPNF